MTFFFTTLLKNYSKNKKFSIRSFLVALKKHHDLRPLPRINMQPFGIKVSIIEPGFFKTAVTRLDIIEADLKRLWSRLPQEVKDSYGPTYFDKCEWKHCSAFSHSVKMNPLNDSPPLFCSSDVKAQDFSLNILCSPDISKVTACMEHALAAQFPRTRYAAGWDAKFFWIPLSYMPSFVSDFVTHLLLPPPKAN